MTDDGQIRLDIYNARRDELLKRQLSNSENFDRAILTVSTAALGFSLAFIKDIVSIETAKLLMILYISWLFLLLAILSTLSSFLIGQHEIKGELDRAERYYIKREETAFEESRAKMQWAEVCNYFSALLFALGVILTCIFTGVNLSQGFHMKNKTVVANDAAISAPIQKIPQTGDLKKGAVIPPMQKVPVTPQNNQTNPSGKDK